MTYVLFLSLINSPESLYVYRVLIICVCGSGGRHGYRSTEVRLLPALSTSSQRTISPADAISGPDLNTLAATALEQPAALLANQGRSTLISSSSPKSVPFLFFVNLASTRHGSRSLFVRFLAVYQELRSRSPPYCACDTDWAM